LRTLQQVNINRAIAYIRAGYRWPLISGSICILFCFSLISGSLSASTVIDTVGWQQGRALFKAECASCHNPAIAQTGPALTGVAARWQEAGDYRGRTGRQWLYAWIRNWNDPVTAQYPYAVRIQNYSSSQMNLFPALSDSDITHILLYVDQPGALSAASGDHGGSPQVSWSDMVIYILLAAVLLALAILFMVRRKQ
jgi:mono/diheme cytochrome c family protein